MPTFILDGHNILYASRPAFLEHLVDGHPGTAAREALVQRLLLGFASQGPEVWLYFDGRPRAHAMSQHEHLADAPGSREARLLQNIAGGEKWTL